MAPEPSTAPGRAASWRTDTPVARRRRLRERAIAGVLFLAAFLHNPGDRGARVYGMLIDLVALLGILVAARQIWIIAQPPGAVAECGASLDYMMDVLPLHEVLGKVLTGSGECAKVDWLFLGLNMPTWVLMALVCVGFWGLLVNWFAPRRGR
jgi:disulfide bond formation protein DsbB